MPGTIHHRCQHLDICQQFLETVTQLAWGALDEWKEALTFVNWRQLKQGTTPQEDITRLSRLVENLLPPICVAADRLALLSEAA